MKNKREYYPFDSKDWKLRRKGVMLRKWERSKEVMELAAREKMEAEIGEPVKLILRLMQEDPRRFHVDISSKGSLNYSECYNFRTETRQSTDRRTGHKMKVVRNELPFCDFSRGYPISRSIYSEENNPWMTPGERLAIYNAIGGIFEAIQLQDEAARRLAEEGRKKNGRDRVMEMYKQEMK